MSANLVHRSGDTRRTVNSGAYDVNTNSERVSVAAFEGALEELV